MTATREFAGTVLSQADLFRFAYTLAEVHPGSEGKRRAIRGGMANVVIEGKLWGLRASRGYCALTYYDLDPDTGEVRSTETRDLRDSKELLTENRGLLTITKQETGPPAIVTELPALISFLEDCDSETVIVKYRERRPPVRELVELYEQGAGADDYAGQTLLEMGDRAKKGLTKILKTPKDKELHQTAGFLLKALFLPSEN